MANLSIPSIRERLFNTSRHEQVTQRNSSNPFAASSFKGNVLTADVFESSTKQNQPAFTGKLKASALVGTISGMGEKFQNMIQSVAAFGQKVKNSVVNGWQKLNNIEVSFNPLKERMIAVYNNTKNIMKTDLTELIQSGISSKSVAKMENMTEARKLMATHVGAWEAAV